MKTTGRGAYFFLYNIPLFPRPRNNFTSLSRFWHQTIITYLRTEFVSRHTMKLPHLLDSLFRNIVRQHWSIQFIIVCTDWQQLLGVSDRQSLPVNAAHKWLPCFVVCALSVHTVAAINAWTFQAQRPLPSIEARQILEASKDCKFRHNVFLNRLTHQRKASTLRSF